MNKFLKILLKGLAVLVALYLIIALFAPADYKVERSKTMSASPEVIFEQVAYFNNWPNWSPWMEKDPGAKYEIEGTDGTVGAKYSWEGDPDLSGKGNMVVTEVVENEKIVYDLTFEDMNMTSNGAITLESTEGGTKITWTDEGDIGFLFRPMMLFVDLDGMIGPDFDRGLTKIDSIAAIRQEEKNVAIYEIKEIDYPGGNFYGIKYDTVITAVDSALYSHAYGELGAFIGMNQIEMAGMPGSIAFEWNEETGRCVLMPVFPVAKIDETIMANPGSKVESFVIPAGKALVIDYYGEYDQIGPAHAEMEAYIQANGLKYEVVLEEYVTDPTTVESMDEVLTRIYYFLNAY